MPRGLSSSPWTSVLKEVHKEAKKIYNDGKSGLKYPEAVEKAWTLDSIKKIHAAYLKKRGGDETLYLAHEVEGGAQRRSHTRKPATRGPAKKTVKKPAARKPATRKPVSKR